MEKVEYLGTVNILFQGLIKMQNKGNDMSTTFLQHFYNKS